MPLYTYQCCDCCEKDERWGGIDDHCATCHVCGELMLRRDEDPIAMIEEEEL